jgi:hypothetical protein
MLKDNIKMAVNVVRLEIVGQIHLAQERDNLHPLVNMVVNFGFHRMRENVRQVGELLEHQKGACTIQ